MPAAAAWPRTHSTRPRCGRLGVIAVVVMAGVGAEARASEVRVVSRTVGEGYRILVPGPGAQMLTRRRLVQYVNLGVYRLLPPKDRDQSVRAHEDGQLRVVSSMRLRHDFGTLTRTATGEAAQLTEALDGRQIDLLFGYLEGERLGGRVDLRVGRQFEMSGLDWYVFDGGWARIHLPAHFALEAFGGFQVDGTAMFGYPTHELDGTWGTPGDDAFTPMVGGAFAIDEIRWMDARFAYRRTWSPSSVNGSIVGPDGQGGLETAVDQEIVSSTLALRLLRGRINAFGGTRYNLGTSTMDDVSVGVSTAITQMHSVRAQYLRTVPAFDLDSIFNVFSVMPFEDVRVVYEVRPGPQWTLMARAQTRVFHADATAELDTEPDRALEVGSGGGLTAAYRRRRFALRLDGYGLGGEGGIRAGGSFDTRTHVWWDRLALDGRMYGVYYDDDLAKDRHGYSIALQAGANWRLWDGIYFNVLGEELFSRFHDHAFRLLGVFSVDWSFRAGRR